MIPLRLTIEGLYSYRERQTIDFTALISAGLFGIFGATGSGKSSILEAISFALYGDTERLNLREKRSYNMMNLKSNRMYIEFDFQNHESKTFRATREYKRNSRRFEDVGTLNTVFYEKVSGAWKPLEHTDASLILDGLSYPNFKRTIIIPQGKFKEFIELGNKDRTQMMKEIFNLQRFDLQDKSSLLLRAAKDQLTHLEGQLTGFEAISEEALKEKKALWEEGKKRQQETEAENKKIQTDFQAYLELRREAEGLRKNLEKLESLKIEEIKIAALKQKLKEYENVHRLFFDLLTRQKEISGERSGLTLESRSAGEELSQLKKSIHTTDAKITDLKPEMDRMEVRKQQVLDYGNILNLLNLNREISDANERIKHGDRLVMQKQQELEDLKEKIAETERKIAAKKGDRMDTGLLLAVSGWFEQKKNLESAIAEPEAEILKAQKKLEQITPVLEAFGISLEEFDKGVRNKEASLEEERETLETHLSHLKISQKMTAYAAALHDGEACPLCGALEHPNVVRGEDVSKELETATRQVAGIKDRIKELQNLKSAVKDIQNRVQIFENQKNNLEEALQNHVQAFRWKEFDPENPEGFLRRKEASEKTENEIEQLEKGLEKEHELQGKTTEDLNKYQKRLNQLEIELARHTASFFTTASALKILRFEDFQDREEVTIRSESEQLDAENKRIGKEYDQAEEKKVQLLNQKSGLEATLEHLQRQLKTAEKKLEEITRKIEQNLLDSGMRSVELVKEILARKLDITASREKIEGFVQEFERLKGVIEDQKARVGSFEDKEETFRQRQKESRESEQKLKAITGQVAGLKTEFKQLKEQFERKTELLKQQEALAKRCDHLNIINNLMKGSGFVQYVSAIYLRSLCDQANIRFHRMTRNQLSLQLNENDEFEIIDYLNEGRSRSVKTLSGGQFFQVSLSLALALAENVQSHNRSGQHFFFIDEGFGTQDQESVNIVFDTLMQLQKENRIVGIISHVEELKDRIPMALNIARDEERGSLIQVFR